MASRKRIHRAMSLFLRQAFKAADTIAGSGTRSEECNICSAFLISHPSMFGWLKNSMYLWSCSSSVSSWPCFGIFSSSMGFLTAVDSLAAWTATQVYAVGHKTVHELLIKLHTRLLSNLPLFRAPEAAWMRERAKTADLNMVDQCWWRNRKRRLLKFAITP